MSPRNDASKDSERSAAEPEGGIRLQKFLAAAGFGSRRTCEEYITSGRVTVDGQRVTELGARVDPKRQIVRVDDEPVRRQPKRYFLLNKPPGYVCTHRDPAGRPRAVDLIAAPELRLFTVGRLDENSRGLLLVTNDGDLGQKLAHPRFQVPRTYRVQVAGNPTPDLLKQLKRGVYFQEGKFRVRDARFAGKQGKSTFLELVLTEGQNREIRRMLARLGHKVMFLERIGFGPLKLGRLALGAYRPLRPQELEALRDYVAQRTERPPEGRPPRRSRRAQRGAHQHSAPGDLPQKQKKFGGSKPRPATERGTKGPGAPRKKRR